MKIFSSLLLLFISVFLLNSCKKDSGGTALLSSIKVIESQSEPKQVKMASSLNGTLLAYTNSGTLVIPAARQEFFILNPSGEVIKTFSLSDTVYQFVEAVPALNGGFFICASSTGFSYISLYHINDNADVVWTKSINVTFGTLLNSPSIAISYDNNYMVMFQSYGSGYYINKTDPSGNEIFNKKIPPPGYIHQGPGLNYGERYVRFYQPNDSMIVIQGVSVDGYDQLVENCFIRALRDNVTQKWFSTNYDSTKFENGAGLIYNNNKIVLAGIKSDNSVLEGYGDFFLRTYALDKTLIGDVILPKVGGTPNTFKQVIDSPDGGYILVGSNNQLPSNDIISPNKIILLKLRPDLSLDWSKSIDTYDPAKGFDLVYLKDGTIGLIGLLKSNLSVNKIIYIHLDSFGNLINN